ncbi:MAG TPA: PAS domain S-box protein [Gemmatimonadaceae bacterium]|jgi:PAS domain S-box-containing protein
MISRSSTTDEVDRFRATFEQAAIGVAHQTLDEQWIWVNKRFCEILGYSREDLLKVRLSELTHPSDIARSMQFNNAVKRGELTEYSIDKRYIRYDGTSVWTHLTVNVIKRADGTSYCVGFLDDITARRVAEQRVTAQFAVARILGDQPDAADAPRQVIEAICRNLEWTAGSLWTVDPTGNELHCVESRRYSRSGPVEFIPRRLDHPLKKGRGLPGRVWETGQPAWISDVLADTHFSRSAIASTAGAHGAFAFPVSSGGNVLGVMEFFSPDIHPADEELLRTISVIGSELGLYLERKRISESVAETEVRKTAIVDAALDCIVSMDHRGILTDFNRAAERVFGYRREDVLGKEMAELIIPPELRDAHRAGVARFSESAEARILNHRVETWGMKADGSRFPVELAITRVPLPGPPTFTGFIRDITERRKNEASLRESEERFRNLTDATLEGILIHDGGVVIDANPAIARMFGYDVSELIGRNVLQLIAAPESLPILLEQMQRRNPDAYEVVGIRRDGSRLDVEITAREITHNGKRARVAAIRDITERKRLAEQERKLAVEHAARTVAESAQQRAAFLAEASRVLSLSFDYHTTLSQLAHLAVPELADYCAVDVVEGENAFVRLGFAHSDPEREEELRSMLTEFKIEDVTPQHPVMIALTQGRSEIITEVTDEGLRNAVINPVQYRVLSSLKPKSLITVPMVASGNVIGALTLLSSRDDRRYTAEDQSLAEELGRRAALAVENARLFDQAQQATRDRDEMLGVVAHDLRNPLNTIFMASQLLLELIPDDQQPKEHRQLEIVKRAAGRMDQLIQDLLDVRRIEGGRLTLEKRAMDPRIVVGEAVDLLRPIAQAQSLRLETDVAPQAAPISVDPPRIQQVLSNLIGNAIKFTPAGGEISLRVTPVNGEVRFAVVDTGPGIAPDALPHIFGRFWQGKRADRRGIGLGLTIAKGIVEAHGGRIWVESQPGEGSSFYFTVPVAAREAALTT